MESPRKPKNKRVCLFVCVCLCVCLCVVLKEKSMFQPSIWLVSRRRGGTGRDKEWLTHTEKPEIEGRVWDEEKTLDKVKKEIGATDL